MEKNFPGLLAAWGRADDRPRFVQARHEEMAALQAVGYAKFSGKVGVRAATSGPGAIHLLNGLYDAKLDHVPVVALVGQTDRSAMGGSYQQEADLQSLYKDVASEFRETAMVPEQLPNLIDRAFRTAYAKRTVTAIILPADVQELDYSPPTHAFKMVPSRLVVAVLNNQDLNQVTWEMRAMSGAPPFEESQHIPDLPYAEIAQRMGLDGVRVEKPENVEAAWDRALSADRPFLIDFRTDPAVPPIPPHASLDQIEAAASAVLKGDSERVSMVRQGLKAKVQKMLPGSRHRDDRPGAGKHDSSDNSADNSSGDGT
ncbi:thiamine pyrophosphate-binding protein [Streptomyces sp. NPDC002328]|uniref:thiamine pyrophosphate-binding protein n=1 Tax=Streptomyces sp. NPDC002328 TaxID=3364642 RepID=UPI0036AD5089